MSAEKAGQRLRETREKKAISLQQAAQVTLIRRHYLEALEKGDFDLLPSAVQARGFLRSYATYLGLEAAEIFSLLESGDDEIAEAAESLKDGPAPEVTVRAAGSSASPAPPAEEQPPRLFSEIGAELKERRELLELSFEEVEVRVRVPAHHLQRLENGEFDNFPSPTQARGMLHNYANFLGLESDALLLRYAEALLDRFRRQQEQESSKAPARKSPFAWLKLPPWLRRFLSRDNLAGALITIALGSLFIWGISRIAATRAEQGLEPTAPALGDLLIPSSTATLDSPQVSTESADGDGENSDTADGEAQITVQVANPRNVELQLVPSQRVWVRVTTDGAVVFEGRLVPGENYAYSANNEVLVFTGNVAALRVYLNGQDLGVLGIEGEVVNLIFSAEGLATPTPSATPAPSATPTLDINADSETPTPSSTPAVDAGDEEQ